jgi:hypothetical protein
MKVLTSFESENRTRTSATPGAARRSIEENAHP